MPIAETAKLMSSLDMDTRGFDKGIAKASKGLNTLSTRTVAAGTAIGVGIERLAEKGLSALGGAIGEGIQGALTLEKAQAQTAAAIASTGGAAGVSAQQVRDYANALEDVTTADDKSIQQGENLLLTFTNIGAKAFPQATEAMVNMAIALNKGDAATADFDGTAIQLGKALNDPIKGITALRKVGVSFNDAQIKAIKTAVKAGDTYKAQQIILAELAKEFGNAGKAAGTGFQADINRANDAVDDAKVALAQGLMPALGEVAKVLSSTFRDPQVLAGIRGLGVGIGKAISAVVTFIRGVDWQKVGKGIQGLFTTISKFVGTIKSAWDQVPDELKKILLAGIVTDRTLKFLLNVSPIKLAVDFAANAAAGIASGVGKAVGASLLGAGLGKFFVQPVFVTNPNFGAGGLPGAAGPAEVATGGLIATAAAVAVGVLGVLGLSAGAQAGAEQVNSARGTNFRVPAGFLDFPTILSNLQEAIKVFNNNTPKGTEGDIGGKIDSLSDRFHTDTVEVGGKIDSLGQRFPEEVSAAIISSSASRDAELSAAIMSLPTGKQQDDTDIVSGIREIFNPANFNPTVKLDASQITDLRDRTVTAFDREAAQRDSDMSAAIATLATQQPKNSQEAMVIAKTASIHEQETSAQIATLIGSTDTGLSTVDSSVVQGAATTSDAARQAGLTASNGAYGAAGIISSAIAANRPITNVSVNVVATTVQKTVDVVTRYGPPGGDRDSSDRNRYG